MGEPHIISALVSKRAELTGQCEKLDRDKAKLRAQVKHIDHVLAIFGYRDPPRYIESKQARTYRFKRRELTALLHRFEADGRTNREIAILIVEFKGWDAQDRTLIAKVADSVKGAKNWRSRKLRTD